MDQEQLVSRVDRHQEQSLKKNLAYMVGVNQELKLDNETKTIIILNRSK